MTRKPRSDSKLDALDLDQQRQLCEWLLAPGVSYEDVKQAVFEKFNVSTTGSSLSAFYQSYCSQYLLQRRRAAVSVAGEIVEEAKLSPGNFDQAAIEAIGQKAFELASNPMCNPKEVKAIFGLMLKARDQDLKRQDIDIKIRRLELLESAAAKAKTTLGNEALTPEEKEREIRSIFGMA
jgi:hypothetical protein